MITITMAAMAMTIAYPSLPRGDCQSLSRGLGPDRPPPYSDSAEFRPVHLTSRFLAKSLAIRAYHASCGMSRKLPIR